MSAALHNRCASLYFAWGPYSGGLYWNQARIPGARNRLTWRLGLGYLAIVYIPFDVDEISLYGLRWLTPAGEAEMRRLQETREATLRLWDTWHREGYNKPHHEISEALGFTQEEKIAIAQKAEEEKKNARVQDQHESLGQSGGVQAPGA